MLQAPIGTKFLRMVESTAQHILGFLAVALPLMLWLAGPQMRHS
jgi:hypothetical protein